MNANTEEAQSSRFAVESKEVVAMTNSTDEVHDGKAFPVLLEEAGKRRRIKRCLGDGAYDLGMGFEALEAHGVEAVVKPRRNSVSGTASVRWCVVEFHGLGYEVWACMRGYGEWWMVETAYSMFMCLFGECSLSRT